MKKTFYLFSLSLIILLSAFAYISDRLTGQWTVETPDGSVNVDFTADGSFKVAANGQTVNEGKYKLVKDTFFTTDNNCGAQEGKYLLSFHTPDSISFKLITDPCTERQGQVNGVIIVRAKDAKK
jgi:flagellar basal body rod protein FlgG